MDHSQSRGGGDTIVLGDLNLDHMKWQTPEPHHRQMIDMIKTQLETLGFAQLVTGVTRTWKGQTSSLLDHCWTNCGPRIASCRNIIRGYSDHNLVEVICRLKGLNKAPKEMIKRQRHNFNLETFRKKASELDWTDVLTSDNVDLSYDYFENKMKKLLEEVSPLKKIQLTNKHKSWLTAETRIKIQNRNLKKDEARLSNLDSSWKDYKKLRNECTNLLRKDRMNSYKKLHEKIDETNDTKELYKQVKSQLGWNSGKTPESFLVDGIAVNSPKKLANVQLKYFNNKITKLIDNLPPQTGDPCRYLLKALAKWRTKSNRTEFKIREITQLETVQLLKKMGNSKSFGFDKLDS